MCYLFEAAYEHRKLDDVNEGKIRFTFHDHTHITRTVKIVNEKCDDKKAPPNVVNDKKNTTFRLDGKKIPPKTELTPGILNLQGFIKTDYENWMKKSNGIVLLPIDVTDDLNIEFDHVHRSELCEVFIRNNTWQRICLESVEMDKSTITMCEEDLPMTIEPRDDLKLHFKAHFRSNKVAQQSRILFRFGRIIVRRTINIQYQARGSMMSKMSYDIPDELNATIASRYRISRSEYKDALDKWVPPSNTEYANHFHNLLFMEECGLRADIKRKYLQREAYFGDQEYLLENGKTIRKKYDLGVYDLAITDLFEIRPSLQLGMI